VAATGVLKDTGVYTQNATGVLDIAITGTTAGTQYDQLNPTTATLGGTLNISRPTGFVPSVGSTFKILNFNSATGTFATVTGLSINSTEHFTITYQPKDVLLTVVSGAAPTLGQVQSSSSVGASYRAVGIGRLGLYGRGGWSNPPRLGPRVFAAALGSPVVSGPFSTQSGDLTGSVRSRSFVDFSGGSRFTRATPAALATRAMVSGPSLRSLAGPENSPSAYLAHSVLGTAKVASMDHVARQNTLNRNAAFVPARNLSVGRAPHNFICTGATGAIHNPMNPAGALVRSNGRAPRMLAPKSMEYHLDVLSLLGASRRQALRGLLGQPGNPNAATLGYFTFNGIR
jgi:hypothetical protein